MILFSEITKKQSACGFMVVNAARALFLTNNTFKKNLCRTSYKEREISTFSHSLGHGGCNKLTSFTCIKKKIWIQKTTSLFLLLVQLDCKELVIPRELFTSGWKYQKFVPIVFYRHFLWLSLWFSLLFLRWNRPSTNWKVGCSVPECSGLSMPNYPWARYWTLCCFPMHSSEYECVDDRKKCLWGMLYKVL